MPSGNPDDNPNDKAGSESGHHPSDKSDDMLDDKVVEIDATGLQCPMPLLKAKRALNEMQSGERLQVLATDGGSVRDFTVFCEQAGHALLASDENQGVYRYLLQKR